MSGWSIKLEDSLPEPLSGIIHHNEGVKNFSVRLFATLQNECTKELPKFYSVGRSPYLCVYFENVLTILSSTENNKILLFKTFDSPIASVTFQKKYDNIIVVLQNYDINIIDILNNECIVSKCKFFNKTQPILLIVEIGDNVFLLVNNSFECYHIKWQNLGKENENDSLIQLLCADKYDTLDEENRLKVDASLKNLQGIQKSSLYYKHFSVNNSIFAICPLTGQKFALDHFQKCISLNSVQNKNNVLLLKESNEKEHILDIFNIYKKESEFKMIVNSTALILGGIDDIIIYIAVKDEKFCLYQIKENSPLSQLEILIMARKYEEAEAFARLHNLSPAAVLELKAKVLLAKLKTEYTLETLAELEEVLKICDPIFILNSCIEGAESDVKLAPLINIARNNIENIDKNTKTRLEHISYKADAFSLLHYEYNDIYYEWCDFLNESPFELCKQMISNYLFDNACIIWVKAYPHILHELKYKNVSDLLYASPADAKLNTILRWLEYFIPSIIKAVPQYSCIFVEWAQTKICSLETTSHWPEIGIQLGDKLANLIFNTKVPIYFIPSNADKFNNLIHSLKQIQMLKNTFNIFLSLKDIMTLPPSEYIKLLLRKAFNEDLQALLLDFLNKYSIRHNLNLDLLIKEYIEELINMSPAIDDVKMEILLNAINNTMEKMQCLIIVLKHSIIPWSKKIKTIAEKAIESKGPLTYQIKMEREFATIREVLMKYKCSEMMSDDYDLVIRRIIQVGNADMMDDILKITNIYSNLKEDSFIFYLQHNIEIGNIDTAIKFYLSQESSMKNLFYEILLLELETLISSQKKCRQIELNYIDFLKSVNEETSLVLNYLENIYFLKNEYNLKISLDKYCIQDYCDIAFSNYCEKTLISMTVDKIDKSFINCLMNIGMHLKINNSQAIKMIIDNSAEPLKKKISEILFDNTDSFFSVSIQSIDIIINLLPLIDLSNINTLTNILKYTIDVLKVCEIEHLTYCTDICSWIYILWLSHNHTKEILGSWKISGVYNPPVIGSVIPILKELLAKYKHANCLCRQVFLCSCSNKTSDDNIKYLQNVLHNMEVQQNDLYFTRVYAYVTMDCLKNNITVPQWLYSMNDRVVKNLITKILLAENPDNILISILLFQYSNSTEWLKEMLMNSIDINRKTKLAKYVLDCRELLTEADISYKLACTIHSQNNIALKMENLGINFKDYQHENSIDANALIESLAKLESFDILTLEEFCLITHITIDDALIFYFFSTLKSWSIKYHIVSDAYNQSEAIFDIGESEMLAKSLNIIANVSSKEKLIDYLKSVLKTGKLNFQNMATIHFNHYCYEIYLFIIMLLKKLSCVNEFKREFILLKFLQSYSRQSKPKQTELDAFTMKETFPKIGHLRLPFQSLISEESWSNLTPDITLDSYERWLSIASLLPLDLDQSLDIQSKCDMICSNAVRQSMISGKNSSKQENTKWSLHLKDEYLLKQAHKCIENITNLDWAGACFYYVYQGCSYGADQVAAAEMCYQFAEHWEKIQPNNIGVKKMYTKHLLTSTAHVLHKLNLADEKLLALCENPQKLIEALYNHECIVENYDCPDINSAVDEICKKNGLDAATIRINILEKFLNISASCQMTRYSGKSTNNILSKENLYKACYILKGADKLVAALYLSPIALETSEDFINYNTKIKALQCLLSLVDEDIIEKVTNLSVTDLWKKLWEIHFIDNLHTIGMEFLISTFLENKNDAVKQIWHSKESNQASLTLILKLLLIYKVEIDNSLLNDILYGVLKTDMTSELIDFLEMSKLLLCTAYNDAWKTILVHPFKYLDTPLGETQKLECFNTLKLMLKCPILPSIDLSVIWKNCVQAKSVSMASIILPHLSEQERNVVIKKIGKINSSDIQEIKKNKSKGIVTTDKILSILKQRYSNNSR